MYRAESGAYRGGSLSRDDPRGAVRAPADEGDADADGDVADECDHCGAGHGAEPGEEHHGRGDGPDHGVLAAELRKDGGEGGADEDEVGGADAEAAGEVHHLGEAPPRGAEGGLDDAGVGGELRGEGGVAGLDGALRSDEELERVEREEAGGEDEAGDEDDAALVRVRGGGRARAGGAGESKTFLLLRGRLVMGRRSVSKKGRGR